MILEHAILLVKPNQTEAFEIDFKKAQELISAIDGYINHSLHKCLEVDNQYLLMVQWKELESHTINFRMSDQYKVWKKLLHHYYDPFPAVEHYQSIY